ncbi:hypothetical protein LCGC14_0920270 [marine sediment metagenome]|uniref:Uncharacterized protein n=1 Tax=marine sediment metagenome TaxID=412755 RepID=A0A0F9PBN7_9ZZZZ
MKSKLSYNYPLHSSFEKYTHDDYYRKEFEQPFFNETAQGKIDSLNADIIRMQFQLDTLKAEQIKDKKEILRRKSENANVLRRLNKEEVKAKKLDKKNSPNGLQNNKIRPLV